MLGFETLFIAWIQVSEIAYKRKNKALHHTIVWKIPLFGIGILAPMAFLEIFKYAFAVTRYPNDGILISVGVVFLHSFTHYRFCSKVSLYLRKA